jgi:hypothetical protein
MSFDFFRPLVFCAFAMPFFPLPAQAVNMETFVSADSFCSIEVGSKGVKARLYKIREDQEGNLIGTSEYDKNENTSIMEFVQDGKISDAAMDENAKVVKAQMDSMLAQSPQCKAFVVGSSGVAKATNKDVLAQKVLALTKLPMDFITPEQEAEYGFLASVPPKYRKDALLIDIGSGNTKLAYRNGDEIKTLEIPYGTTSLAKEMVEKQKADFSTDDYKKKIIALIQPDFRSKAQSQPKLLNHTRLYWNGGVAWATATYAYPEFSLEDIVRIQHTDISNFIKALEKNSRFDFKTSIPKKTSERAKEAHEKDWEKVQSTFPRERLLSSLTLMQVMMQEGNPNSRINFLRNGQWLYAYTREKFIQARQQ